MSELSTHGNAAPLTLRKSNDGPVFQLRMDEFAADRVPKTAPIELLLPTWDFDSVLIVAALVRVAKSPKWTFELWLDGTAQIGIAALNAIASDAGASVRLGHHAGARTMRTPNTIRGTAKSVIRRLQKWQAWGGAEYQTALQRVRRMYPTPHESWLEARRR